MYENGLWSKMRFGAVMVVTLMMFAGVAQAQSMDGSHVGVFAGYTNGTYQSEATPEIDHEPSGAFGGVQLGWSHSSGSLIFGVDGDVAFSSIDGEDSVTVSGFESDVSHDINYLGTLRARLGGMAGPAMIYGTAGLAMADLDNQLVVTSAGNEVGRDEEGSRHMGWAAGAGAEFPITPKVSIAVEYLHIDMGDEEISVNIAGFPFTDKGDLNLNTVRFGVNFRF